MIVFQKRSAAGWHPPHSGLAPGGSVSVCLP